MNIRLHQPNCFFGNNSFYQCKRLQDVLTESTQNINQLLKYFPILCPRKNALFKEFQTLFKEFWHWKGWSLSITVIWYCRSYSWDTQSVGTLRESPPCTFPNWATWEAFMSWVEFSEDLESRSQGRIIITYGRNLCQLPRSFFFLTFSHDNAPQK